ncbi:30S ribosomal protein S2 [Candidatus Hepatoplasma crinochetorum]|uniref:30S ribosomal protein S2 n=1 Tax=Candidatus Hepatoplasma crinochetorum TaxID=295596 RepID=UPI0030867A90|nr:MAG: hypothetical protein HCTKY_1610 [Candidatus Hepatoplasma crinochetorum]
MINEQENNSELLQNENLKPNNNDNSDKKLPLIAKEKLLEAGVQFGHKTQRWNPAMKPFIHGEKNGTHIINLNKVNASLNVAYNAINKIAAKGGKVLFVGTNKHSKKTIKENSLRVKTFYVNERWLGGTLTNFKTIQNSVRRLRYLEKLEKDNFAGYTKKEAVKLQKELDKAESMLGGIKFMRRLPDAIFVTSVSDERIVIKEADKLQIPVIGIVDTNCNPRDVKIPIFANDDANKSISLITTIIADAIADAKGEERKAAFLDKDAVEFIGLEKSTYRKTNFRNASFEQNSDQRQKDQRSYNQNYKNRTNLKREKVDRKF